MATTQRQLTAPPERVFAVLADAGAYGDWVVGSDTIRDADAHWPAPGSRFYHRVGTGPIKVEDHTEVLEAQPPMRLVLRARARPLGTARVEMILIPRDGGTLVTMIETGADPLSRLAVNPLTGWVVHLRNRRSLGRLARIAETGVVET